MATQSGAINISSSPQAAAVLSDLRARFKAKITEHSSPTDETLIERTHDVLLPTVVTGFAANVGGVSPLFPGPPTKGEKRATLRLPASAAGGATITDPRSGLTVTVAPRGVSATATSAEGYLVYAGAKSGTEHLVRRAAADGVEDFLNLEVAPTVPELIYDVALGSGAVGVRLVENVFEVLDAGGAPRLRVPSPYVVDSLGKRTTAILAIGGCLFDSNPADPVGRKVTAPGSSSCVLRVTWSSGTVVYPALVDPAFTLTTSMPAARWDHPGVALPTGDTLVIGGWLQPGSYLYNPVAQTWSVTGTPAKSRDNAMTALLQDGNVLYAGGYSSGTEDSAERYLTASGSFAAAGTMVDKIERGTASLLPDGKVLVAGGFRYVSSSDRNYTARCELYNPNTNTWSLTGSMPSPHGQHGAVTLTSGKVLVVSGNSSWPSETPTATSELYDPTPGSWSSAGSIPSSRYRMGITLLAYGSKVLVSGGYGGGGWSPLATTVIFDPLTNDWTTGPTMSTPRVYHSAAMAANGRVLLAGGLIDSGTTSTATTEQYDQATNTIAPGASMNVALASFSTTPVLPNPLDPPQLLLAGGYTPGNSSSSTAELYDTAPTSVGAGALGDTGALPPVSVHWSQNNTKGTFASSTTKSFIVANNSDTTRYVYVDLVATGLDDRGVRRSNYADLSLAPNTTQTLSVAASQFPVQSVGTESEVVISAREYDGGKTETGLVVPSDPLYYEFLAGYTTVILHGIEGADLDRTQPSQSTTQGQLFTSMAPMMNALLTRVGRIWDDSLGSWTDVASLSKPGSGNYTYSQSYVARGQWAKDAAAIKGGGFSIAYTPPPGSPFRTLCPNWRARFVDVGLGDDFLNPTNPGDPDPKKATIVETPARYASAFLTTGGSPVDVVWSGNLDANGCATAQLGPGDFDLFWFSDAVKGSTQIKISLGDKGMNGGSAGGFAFSSNPPFTVATFSFSDNVAPPGPYALASGNDEFVSRVASVMSLALSNADSGLASGLYTVLANDPCLTNSVYLGACGNGSPSPVTGTLRIGYNVGQITDPAIGVLHNSIYKNVIAHEFGHTVFGSTTGSIYFDYDTSEDPKFQRETDIAECRCDYQIGSNKTHCLQSREKEGFAESEGYAHFIAARLFNDPAQANCKFIYYKYAIEYQQSISAWGFYAPPRPSECYYPVQWMREKCASNAMTLLLGNEWDYLGFFYQMNRTSATPYTLADLSLVYRNACSGSTGGTCAFKKVNFDKLESGSGVGAKTLVDAACELATAQAGQSGCLPQLAKAAAFRNQGTTYGITF